MQIRILIKMEEKQRKGYEMAHQKSMIGL